MGRLNKRQDPSRYRMTLMLRNLKLAPRSVLSFGAIALVVVLLGGFSVVKIQEMSDQSMVISEKCLPNIMRLSDLVKAQLRNHAVMAQMAAVVDPVARQEGLDNLQRMIADARVLRDALATGLSDAAERAAFEQLIAADQAYGAEQQQIIAQLAAGNLSEAVLGLKGNAMAYGIKLGMATDNLMKLNVQGYERASEDLLMARDSARKGVLFAVLAAAIMTIGLAVLYTRSIVQPLSHAVEVLDLVSKGDLTREISVSDHDEPALVLRSLKLMQTALRAVMDEIAGASLRIATSVQALDTVSESSTRSMHRQDEEVTGAVSVVQVASQAIDEVARNAAWTAEASHRSDLNVRAGCEQVEKMVDAIVALSSEVELTNQQIHELATSIASVTRIIEVIRTVAEQTNLLALNAAIEAARAGEAGRGFAVVADEVRALAHRTKDSTQEIEVLIGRIQAVTGRAVQSMQRSSQSATATLGLAGHADQALKDIRESIETISARSQVISGAASEQAGMMIHVNQSLRVIQGRFQDASEGVSQTRQASRDLASQAQVLSALVSRFQT